MRGVGVEWRGARVERRKIGVRGEMRGGRRKEREIMRMKRKKGKVKMDIGRSERGLRRR